MKNDLYINRELSWLSFNERVLEEARDKNNPLLERLKFLSIFCSNLDEFFMVRVGGLYDQSLTGLVCRDAITGMTTDEQLSSIYRKTRKLMEIYNNTQRSLFSLLKKAGIKQIVPNKLSTKDAHTLREEFVKRVSPLISTFIVDGKHPFPYLPNKMAFIGLKVRGKSTEKLGLILFPEAAEKIVFHNDEDVKYFLLEGVAEYFAEEMFPKHKVLSYGKFRITRNADLELDDEAAQSEENYRQAMQLILERRKRLMAVRLQTNLAPDHPISINIANRLGITEEQIFKQEGPLEMNLLWKVIETAKSRGLKEHFYQDMKSVYTPGLLRGESVIAQVKNKDFVMIHPYVSFDSVLTLLREAAYDPHVIAIRQTLYRVSNDSEVVRYLVAAAQNGKDVTVLVELKARFDEANNINWAAKLEDAGCRVIYGRDFLKVHSKLLLVTRNTTKGLKYTAHVATGNYNEETAKLYTDVGILTSNEDIAKDIMLFFRELGTGVTWENYRVFDVSPNGIRQKIYKLINEEIECAEKTGYGHIIIKINSLADIKIIDKLIQASKAGVKVDLIVRGICCLKAGVDGATDNIRVVSIVGRFLEHSRVYWFSGGGEEKMFISSADLMTRNLDRRMEVMFPVFNRSIVMRLKQMLNTLLKDVAKGRIMQPCGRYIRLEADDGIHDSQMVQYKLCVEDYKRRMPQLRRNTVQSFKHVIGRVLIGLGKKMSSEYYIDPEV